MTKTEFLIELRENLEGEVASGVINENVNYYSRYIDDEVRSGKTEEEVIETLGRGSMIAKSIIQAEHSHMEESSSESGYRNSYGYGEENREEKPKKSAGAVILKVLKTILIVLAVIVVLVIGLIFLWKVVLPLALVALVVWAIFKLVKMIVNLTKK